MSADAGHVSHRVARGFGAVADAYDRGRSGYAPEAIARLETELELSPGMRVLDLGAGTGKLTAMLAPSGAELVAVEPDPRMRERLQRALPGATALDGSAEAIPLADGAVQAVVAGSAFHWFDHPRALREIHRVLTHGGRLALLWNPTDDPASPWWDDVYRELQRSTDTQSHASREWAGTLTQDGLFDGVREWWFPWVAEMTTEQVLDRVMSISYVAALDPAQRDPLLDRVRAVLDSHPQDDGTYTMRYRTRLICCRRTP
ncbi:MAG: class I SAM-dependent methyltransferase [Gaiellales bacterium]